MPRPMEVHAHDPLRYLGDMLAWVHQSLASERDLFVALFGTDPASAQVRAPAAACCTHPSRQLCAGLKQQKPTTSYMHAAQPGGAVGLSAASAAAGAWGLSG